MRSSRSPVARPESLEAALTLPVKSGAFAVVGDLQPTSGLEVWRESNPHERRTLIREIASASPDFLAMLGDLVFCGSSAPAWSDFDRLCGPLRSQEILALPVLGNHEYWLSRRRSLGNFFSRFPHLDGRHWYTATYGRLGLVFLDSNSHWLTREEWRDQLEWLEARLRAFDEDPAIRGVLVLIHHPPFTNSRVTSDTLHVQRDVVPRFQASRKALAMISGHVHSYERFERGGRTYLVAGGGGGPRARLNEGPRRRHTDDAFDGGPLRHFHYLMLRPSETGLEVDVRGLEKAGTECAPMDDFRIPWPESGAGP